MCQRGQIARCTYRALRGDAWPYAAVEQGHQQVDDLGPHARVPHGDDLGAQQHHGAHFVLLQIGAYPASVAADQVALQLDDVGGVDAGLGQSTETRVDAVGRRGVVTGGHDGIYDATGGLHTHACVSGQRNGSARASHLL